MGKIIITILIALCSINIGAQEPHKVYCELIGVSNLTGTSIKINVDMGQPMKFGKLNQRAIYDDNGEKIKFNSMIDALNYFGKLGWSFVQAYAISTESDTTQTDVYHYIMSKVVSKNEEMFEGLKFKD